MVVTFTVKAAEELKERITGKLLHDGQHNLAAGLAEARIGTINGVCGELVQSFAFELGLSPEQRVIDEQEAEKILVEALDACLVSEETNRLNELENRFSLEGWSKAVLDLVRQARLNKINTLDFHACATSSYNELDALLPATDSSITENSLRDAMRGLLKKAESLPKMTKGLGTTVSRIEILLKARTINWENWVQLSKWKGGTKEEYLFDELRAVSGRVLMSPVFRTETKELISKLFDAAGRVLEKYSLLKTERGLVDFVDQELLLLNALDVPVVEERLKEQLRYLVVDEFQDTSPIQLALFSKLSELAEDTLFVGDTKQAIYGFRGTDSSLSLNVLKHFQSGAGEVNALKQSWRSRAGLVHLANALFEQPFNSTLTPEQVKLTPAPEKNYHLQLPEVGWWTLGGSNTGLQASALASGVKELMAEDFKVWDKDRKDSRPLKYRDIAILCRSNSEIAELAAKLSAQGIPVASSRSGLLETPEVTLALACFRRLIDSKDSLASAEIVSMARGQNPEAWLDERLLSIRDESYAWDDQAHPILASLSEVRHKVLTLSPEEVLSLAIQTSGLLDVVVSWDESKRLTDHRLANLQALQELTEKYGEHCHISGGAGTAAGLLLWLRNLEQNFSDDQADNPGDAVRLTTYHGSKGLEWNVVICSSLDKALKASLYGVRIVSDADSFDWNNPLNQRELRYWPNPFPVFKGNDPLTALLKLTDEWSAKISAERQEALQLLYVGMTRARDHLVLTHSEKSKSNIGQWLGLLESDLFPLTGDSIQLPCGNSVQVALKALEPLEDGTSTSTARVRHWVSSSHHQAEKTVVYNSPPSTAEPLVGARAVVAHDFQSRIKIVGNHSMDKVGDALHHALSLLLIVPETDESTIQDLMDARVPGALRADEVSSQACQLMCWIKEQFPQARLFTEVPIMRNLNSNELESGRIDLLLAIKGGWIIIDHKSNPQSKDSWSGISLKYSGQLKAYSDALLALTGKPVFKSYIHFAVSGGLVEVDCSEISK